MIFHDDEDGDHQNRRIFKVTWQKQRPKGYLVTTGIIKKSNSNVDQSEDAQQDYKISADLHTMISEELNEGYFFQQRD